jgi:hypothetical protein
MLPRAASVGAVKNSDPASETVKHASPHMLAA